MQAAVIDFPTSPTSHKGSEVIREIDLPTSPRRYTTDRSLRGRSWCGDLRPGGRLFRPGQLSTDTWALSVRKLVRAPRLTGAPSNAFEGSGPDGY